MTDTQPSGADLARTALAAARAAAKTRPTQLQKKTTRPRRETRRSGRDPMGLGAAITGLMADRGWEPPEEGGSILDQWPAIAPELADKVAAVRFEHDTGTLHLRPASPAYGTQLRLHQTQILARVQQAPAGRSVRALKILPVGAMPTADSTEPSAPPAQPAEAAPIRTRETAAPGYQQALTAALENRPAKRPTDPYLERAMRRQEAALRANRQPDSEDREAEWAQQETVRKAGPAEGSIEASIAAAIRQKRREAAGLAEPRRAFDVA